MTGRQGVGGPHTILKGWSGLSSLRKWQWKNKEAERANQDDI